MNLVTVKDIELAATGKYALESGETEFTEAHLADAVRASTDPTIVAPRIKLGHDFAKVFGDAAPAFGRVENMRLTENGQKIVGDLVSVPEWLAAGLAAHYPGRSIEGGFDMDAPSGNSYKLVISDLALLGESWPGITNLKDVTLDDLQSVLTANGKIGAPVKVDDRFKLAGDGTAKSVFTAKLSEPQKVEAKLNVADFRKVFAADLRSGAIKLADADAAKVWARSVEADDDGALSLLVDDSAGKLIELPVTVEGEGLKYGEPRERTAVAASSGKATRVLASWPSAGESPNSEETTMDISAMRASYGLPEDADEAAVLAAIAADPTKLSAEPAKPAPTAAKLGDVPDGFVLVDKATLDTIQAGAAAGTALAVKAADADRDKELDDAIEAGKFAAGSRQSFVDLWALNAEKARAIIAGMPEGLIPVSQIARATGGDDSVENEDALVARIEDTFFPELREAEHSVVARARAIATTGGQR